MGSIKPHVFIQDAEGHYLDYSAFIQTIADFTSSNDGIPSFTQSVSATSSDYGNALYMVKKLSSYVDCDTDSTLNLTASDSFSATFKWKKTTNSDENSTTIFSRYGDSGSSDTIGWEISNYHATKSAGRFLISECEDKVNWAAVRGTLTSESDSVDGVCSLKLLATAADAYAEYSFPEPVDMGSYDLIEFYAKSGTGSEIADGEITVYDSSDSYRKWDFSYPAVWERKTLRIDGPDSESPNTTMSDIVKFRFDVNTDTNSGLIDEAYYSGGYGHFRFLMAATTTTDGVSREIDLATRDSFADGNWHDVAVTKTTATTADGITMYVDGSSQVLVTTTDSLCHGVGNSNYNYIGARSDGNPTNFHDGYIDELRLYDCELGQAAVDSIKGYDLAAITSSADIISYWNFDEKPISMAFDTSWDKSLNKIGAASVAIAGIDEADTNIRVARGLHIVEDDLKKWLGPIRETNYSTTKIAEVAAKTWEVNLEDRKYYNTTNADYDGDWTASSSSDILGDLIVSSDLSEGHLADYKNTYDFHIKNDTAWHGVTKNGDITGFDYYVSEDQKGGEE